MLSCLISSKTRLLGTSAYLWLPGSPPAGFRFTTMSFVVGKNCDQVLLLYSVLVLVVVAVPNILGYTDPGGTQFRKYGRPLSIEINVLPEMNRSTADSLTIFELVMLSKLQSYGEDVMGVRRFQEPFWVSTPYLVNLLDSSQWSLRKAKRKFQKAMDWRTNNMKFMKRNPAKNMFEFFTFEMKGFDREGCPVIIVPFGEWRTYRSYLEKLKSIYKANANLKIYLIRVMEEILQKVSGNLLCSHITLIADMENYTVLHNSGLRFFIDTIKEFEKSYPGLLKEAFIINSSPAFLKVAQSYKSTLPWDLRRKSFLYTDRNYWEEALLTSIDPSQIAPKYGGDNFFLESR